MTNYVMLDSEKHADLKVDETAKGVGSNRIRNTYVVVHELQRASGSYPLFFIKNPDTGMFSLICLLGFNEGENLFIDSDKWDARYIPLNIRRGPFALGEQAGNQGNSENVVLVDLDDSRVSGRTGEVAFNERGFPTDYLEEKLSILKTLNDGKEKTDAFVRKLLELDMIMPATFQISFDDGSAQKLQGLYTVDQDKLQRLDSKDVMSFYENGYFEYVYMMIASIGQMEHLIDRKNQSLNTK